MWRCRGQPFWHIYHIKPPIHVAAVICGLPLQYAFVIFFIQGLCYFEFHFGFHWVFWPKNSQELPRISDCGGGSPWLESVGDELDSGFLGATLLDISNLIDIRKQDPALTFILLRSPLSLCMLQTTLFDISSHIDTHNHSSFTHIQIIYFLVYPN